MNAFDSDEQNIYDAFSQITVNTSRLAGQVKSRLHEETPCSAAPRRRRWPVSAVAAVVLSVLLVGTAAAASLGGFNWFIEKFSPDFGKIAKPVEVSCEDQGIKMEVIGAQKFGNKAVIYLSLQDISGKNRITEKTDFNDGFYVRTKSGQQSTGSQSDASVSTNCGWKKKIIYFDEKSDTIYFEFNIDSELELSDTFEIGTSLVYFDSKDYKQEPLPLPLSDIGEAETIPIEKGNIFGGNSATTSGAVDVMNLKKVLAPGKYASLSLGDDNQWISNIGIVDGKLHVQTGKVWNTEFGSNDALLTLLTSNGDLIEPDFESMILSDKDGRLINLNDDFNAAAYKYGEYVFSVDTKKLDAYTLCYTGSVTSGVEGKWNATLNLGDTSQQTRVFTNDTSVDGCFFKNMMLSPLGLQVIGSYENEDCRASQMSLQVETANGVIPLETGGGSYNVKEKTFNLQWNTKKPLDVSKATAIIINGTRVPVQ